MSAQRLRPNMNQSCETNWALGWGRLGLKRWSWKWEWYRGAGSIGLGYPDHQLKMSPACCGPSRLFYTPGRPSSTTKYQNCSIQGDDPNSCTSAIPRRDNHHQSIEVLGSLSVLLFICVTDWTPTMTWPSKPSLPLPPSSHHRGNSPPPPLPRHALQAFYGGRGQGISKIGPQRATRDLGALVALGKGICQRRLSLS